jgi:hypothetical protein
MLDTLKALRDETLGPERAKRLAEIDNAYRQIVPLRDASAMKGAVMEDYYTPSQMVNAALKGDSAWGRAAQKDPALKRALAAQEVFGDTIPAVGPGTAEKLYVQSAVRGAAGAGLGLLTGQVDPAMAAALGAYSPVMTAKIMPAMRKPIVGRTKTQKRLRDIQSPLAEQLRRARAYTVAPAVLGAQDEEPQ